MNPTLHADFGCAARPGFVHTTWIAPAANFISPPLNADDYPSPLLSFVTRTKREPSRVRLAPRQSDTCSTGHAEISCLCDRSDRLRCLLLARDF